MNPFNVGKEFSMDPCGRFYTDGVGSGEEFREEYLKVFIEELREGEKLNIILDDGVESYGSSFLTEGFAGMVKFGYIESESLRERLEFEYANKDFIFYEKKIFQYISEAIFASKDYAPTK